MAPRSRTTWGLFVTFAVLGFLLATQLRVQENLSHSLDSRTLDELTALIGTLNQENDRLQEEWADLNLRLITGRYAGESDVSLIAEQKRILEELRLVTGSVPGVGPGVILIVRDAQAELEAYDMTQLVNELRSAGAEAIMINGRRVGFRAGFFDTGNGIVMSGVPLEQPYRIEAVGVPQDLISSVAMPGGVVPSLEQRPGVTVTVQALDSVSAPPTEMNPRFVFAVPAEE
ncbi:MAG: DUF881 domain-containing protein [Actinobacteria bacterium]|nr:DUF881 domain-containing protein [Actinomycetota bacterium]